jgi:hypothetical protein
VALPETDLDWLTYLSRRHDAERPELEAYDRYYDGTQPLTYMHPEIMREVADRIQPVIIAWPQLCIDSLEERLDVEGFRLPDEESADDDLWRVWQANDMDEQSQLGHVDALTMRRYYVAGGTNETDDDTPLLTAESPLEVFADHDPRTRKVRAALRRVVEADTVARIGTRYATLYLPNATVYYEWNGGGWLVTNRDDHNLGEVPIVPVVNRARLNQSRRIRGMTQLRHGRSELDPVIPLSDAANKIATDMMLAAEFVSIPLRGLWGVGPEDLVDDVSERCGGVDQDAVLRGVFFGSMQAHDELAFRLLCAELVFRPLIESPVQSVQIDLQDEDPVEQVEEFRGVSRAAAEEGEALILVGDQGSDSVHRPDVMPVRRHVIRRLTRFRVPLIGQVGVTIDGVISTPA